MSTARDQKTGQDVQLLPCPFCGGEAELISPTDTDRWAQVNCKSCGCRGTEYPAEISRAIAAWNRRRPPAAVTRDGWEYVYAKPWRTLIHVPKSIAGEVRDALTTPAPQAGVGPEQLFVVHNSKTGTMFIFSNHDAALRCRFEQKLSHECLWGCVIFDDWQSGEPLQAASHAGVSGIVED